MSTNLQFYSNFRFDHFIKRKKGNLIDKVADYSQITGEMYEEQAMLPVHQQGNDRLALLYLYFNKLI